MAELSQQSIIQQMREVIRARRTATAANPHQKGMDFLGSGEFEKAAAAFRRAVAENPGFPFSPHYLGEALYQSGEYEEAENAFIEAAALNPHFAATQTFLGDLAVRREDWQAAETFYRRAIDLMPNSVSAVIGLAKIIFKSNPPAADSSYLQIREMYLHLYRLSRENRSLLLELLDTDIPDARFFCDLGDALITDNEPEAAVICFRRALQQQPELLTVWLKIARIFFDADEDEAAEECLQKAVTPAHESVEIYTLLGYVRAKQNELTEAIAAYRQAVELAPETAELHKQIGDLFSQQGLINDAQEAYRCALELGYQVY